MIRFTLMPWLEDQVRGANVAMQAHLMHRAKAMMCTTFSQPRTVLD